MSPAIGPAITGPSPVPALLGDGGPLVLATSVLLVVAWSSVAVAWVVARRHRTSADRAIATSLTLSATAAVLWTLSAALGTEPAARLGGLPVAGIPLVAHGLFLLAYPVLFVGLLRRTEVGPAALHTVRITTDALITVLVGGALLAAWWVPVTTEAAFDLFLSTAYPAGDLVRLALVIGIWSTWPSATRRGWNGWPLALLAWTVADLAALAALVEGATRATLPAVVGYALGYLVILKILVDDDRTGPARPPRTGAAPDRAETPIPVADETDPSASTRRPARSAPVAWSAVGILIATLAIYDVLGRPVPAALALVAVPVLLLGTMRLLLRAELADRSARRRAVRELAARWTELRARSLLEHAVDPYLEFDDDDRILAASERLGTLIGHPSAQLVGRDLTAILADASHRSGLLAPGARPRERRVNEHAADGLPDGAEVALRHRDGEVVPVAVSAWTTTLESEQRHHVFVRDLRPQRRREADLMHHARHDRLTGLPNRYALDMDIPALLEASRIALLLLDLDGFKAINDRHGHAVGDAVLVALAERLRGSTRDEDLLVRLGGDEFALIVTAADETLAVRIAERTVALVADPIVVDGHELRLGVSVGVALSPDHGLGLLELLRSADAAMYRAKHGRHGVSVADGAALGPHAGDVRPTGPGVGPEGPTAPTVSLGRE